MSDWRAEEQKRKRRRQRFHIPWDRREIPYHHWPTTAVKWLKPLDRGPLLAKFSLFSLGLGLGILVDFFFFWDYIKVFGLELVSFWFFRFLNIIYNRSSQFVIFLWIREITKSIWLFTAKKRSSKQLYVTNLLD